VDDDRTAAKPRRLPPPPREEAEADEGPELGALSALSDLLARHRVEGRVAPEEETTISLLMAPSPDRADRSDEMIEENDQESGDASSSDEDEDDLA
jgi:hypothetical protein